MEKTPETQSLTRAQTLAQDYQQVLQSVNELLTLGAPETLLPAAKEEIRQALRRMALTTVSDGLANPMALDRLRTAYLSLANFLPYEEANAAARLQTAFDRGDRTYIGSPIAAQTMARVQRIEQQASQLALEFDAFLRHNESGSLLSDIDTLLAELDRKFTSVSSV